MFYKIQSAALMVLMAVGATGYAQSFDAQQALDFAVAKVKQSAEEVKDSARYPRNIAPDGQYWKCVGAHDWTSGFYPGILWLAYEASKDESLKQHAERWTRKLEEDSIHFHSSDHDIGFMMYCSWGTALRITGDKAYKPVILQSAHTAITRYNDKVGLIKSWDHLDGYGWKYPVIIDNMMNLELLFWAAKNGGNKKMYDIAVSHATNTMKHHFREDGSTFHVLNYHQDAAGVPTAKFTWQGYQNTSLWARGQAWAIYGFTLCHRATKNKQFLATAQKAADRFLTGLPDDMIPYWDYNAPYIAEGKEERDASAAAIAASAMLELSTMLTGNEKQKYWSAAEKILSSLSQNYTSAGTSKSCILLHSVGAKPFGGEVDYAINYADYYYLEALLRYKNLSK